jgi:hypothetical protein
VRVVEAECGGVLALPLANAIREFSRKRAAADAATLMSRGVDVVVLLK